MTKCLDQLLFQFYQKNDELRITDLHQGIVWGTNTPWTVKDERLINRFDYDSDYGTVLNRFLMQASLGYPLTVYGTGGQTRAFIHIQDTCKCIALAVENPPASGAPVEIFNQVAETHRVRDLAKMISDLTGKPKERGDTFGAFSSFLFPIVEQNHCFNFCLRCRLFTLFTVCLDPFLFCLSLGCEVKNISNPRKEAAENELVVSNEKFRTLGYEPMSLEAGLFDEVRSIAEKYRERCDLDKIMPSSFWNKTIATECAIDESPYKLDSEVDEGILHVIAKGDKNKIEKLKAVLREN